MKSFLVLLILALFSSCAPDMQKPVPDVVEYADTTTVYEVLDTLGVEDFTVSSTVIEIYDDKVVINSPNVSTTYVVDAGKVVLKRSENGLLEYLQVDNDILFKENVSNHNYKFIDPHTIEVQAGNTVSGIMADYKISKRAFYKCNSFLKQRSLQVGDRVFIKC